MENIAKRLIDFEQARKLVLSAVTPGAALQTDLLHSLNRVLAEDVFADSDMPPFNKSAMDGYACRHSDLGGELKIIDEIPAGSVPNKTIEENQCARIMTGAMVPEGADFVLMKEYAEKSGPDTIRCTRLSQHSNICYRAEDIREGDRILSKGTLLNPSHIAVLATFGISRPLVYSVPAVAVISTGNELVEPDQAPRKQQIRNSNGPQLMAQLEGMGISADYLGIVRDSERDVYDSLSLAFAKYDVILISGGVSVGDYDYVPAVLEKLGAAIQLHGLNVKPGKHLLFATLKETAVFGLPGNPVSSFVQFELLVRQFLLKKMGCEKSSMELYVPMAVNYYRQKAENMLFVPVSFTEDGMVQPIEYHGSAHIHAYTMADGILEIPVGKNDLKKGEFVHVRPL
jgi:molybdopterin molybdotransferase